MCTRFRGHLFKLFKPPAYIYVFDTRAINDWNNLTRDIVENSSLINSFKSAVDIDWCFTVNVIITSVFYCM